LKAVAILGSARPGSNSNALAKTILESLKANGAEVQEFILNELSYKGCQGCEVCKTKLDDCVQKDDLTPVLQAVRDSDAVILATPNYFGEVSGQFKLFFDRTYSLLNPGWTGRLAKGKSAVFVFSQGVPDLNMYSDVFPRYERWLKIYGFTNVYLLRMGGPREPNSVEKRPELIEQAVKIAEDLLMR